MQGGYFIKKKRLCEIAKIFTGVRIDRYILNSQSSDNKSYEEKPVITQKISNNKLNIEFKKVSKIDSQYYSKNEDILIRLTEPNNVYLIENDGIIIHSNYAIIRLKEGYDYKYIYYLLKSNEFLKQIHKKLTGTILKTVSINDLKQTEFEIPKLKKQRKYGKLLELIEKKLELEKKSLELKENYYKTFSNQILGENTHVTIPKPIRK